MTPNSSSPQTPSFPSLDSGSLFLSTPSPSGEATTTGTLVLQPGARPLPEYELVRRLGRGGTAEVWQANGPGGVPAALKFVPYTEGEDHGELRALEMMRTIRHPNLVALFGAWTRDGYLIIAQELADGTLMDRLKELQAQGQSGIPLEELLDAMDEAARGLDFLNEPRHMLGEQGPVSILHRDVKPPNLMLVGGGVKVADFGLAKCLVHTRSQHTGSCTPHYVAPEAIAGEAHRQSDQYALAVTYCQLRTGQLPFPGDSMQQVLFAHLQNPPDLSGIPAAEQQVASRALAKKPEERWPTCRAFVAALRACQYAPLSVPGPPSLAPAPVAVPAPVEPQRIQVVCAICNEEYTVLPTAAGHSVRCPSCRAVTHIPALLEQSAASETNWLLLVVGAIVVFLVLFGLSWLLR